jgi:hypothetical protein
VEVPVPQIDMHNNGAARLGTEISTNVASICLNMLHVGATKNHLSCGGVKPVGLGKTIVDVQVLKVITRAAKQ